MKKTLSIIELILTTNKDCDKVWRPHRWFFEEMIYIESDKTWSDPEELSHNVYLTTWCGSWSLSIKSPNFYCIITLALNVYAINNYTLHITQQTRWRVCSQPWQVWPNENDLSTDEIIIKHGLLDAINRLSWNNEFSNNKNRSNSEILFILYILYTKYLFLYTIL